ncbi:MAG: hypothetical protein K6G34_07210 [Lachnospiraceae bacterium]|nr:hypothetical protein [Lachnospiraceae bacterium]
MANVTYKGTGVIAAGDYHAVKFVGKTKAGKTVTIEMAKAINLGNLDWTFAEKDDTVAQIVWTGVYDNTDSMTDVASDYETPYTITLEDGISAGAAEIMLGAGLVYIDNALIALTRGGSQFTSTREFRRINADGDRGAVEGRIVLDAEEPTLTLNALTILTKFADLYPAVAVAT